MTEFMDEFMDAMSVVYPKLLIQFEVSVCPAPIYQRVYASGHYPVT